MLHPISNRLATAIVAATVVLAPLALGCSSAEARFGLETAIGVAVCLWLYARPSHSRLPWVPLCVFAALLIQQIPIPDRILVNVAPVSAGAWKIADADNPSNWGTISVHPAASLAATSRILLLAATLAMIVDLGRYRSHRFTLLAGLAASAIVIVGLGLCFGSARQTQLMLGVFDISGPSHKTQDPTLLTEQTAGLGWPEELKVDDRRYILENRGVGDGFGSYRYSNHFAGGTILTLPVAIALWLSGTRKRLHAAVRWGIAAGMFGGALWVVAVMAQSRAGAGGLCSAALTLVYLNTASRPWKVFMGLITTAYAMLIGGLLAFMLGAWHWILPVLTPEWQKVMLQFLSDGRAVAAQVSLRMFRASPWLGTGLTSFEQMFPRFHSSHTRLYFAHNDYMQILAETGLVGGVAIAALAVLATRRFRRFDKDAGAEYRELNSGCWAALAGITIHSAFDWNLYLPANACLWCVILGLCISSAPAWQGTRPARAPWPWAGAVSRLLLLAAMLGAFGVLARDYLSERAKRNLGQTLIAVRLDKEAGQQLLRDRLAQAIAATRKAADRDPANATLAVLLSQAYLRLATLVTDAAAKEQSLNESDDWGRRARRLNPTCPGIPETVPTRP